MDLQTIIDNSAFNRQKYEVNIPVKNFISSLMMYLNANIENPSFKDILDNGVPAFQRSNDQWSLSMQIKFVENVIKGFVPRLQLFEIEGKDSDCQILDGLQRTTALSNFIENKFKVFDDNFAFYDIKDSFLKGMSKTVVLEVFKFDNINDVIDFYVEMNENITHSPEDIVKALSFKTK